MNINTKKAECIVELKDGRSLIKYDNGFTFFVKNSNGTMDEVSEKYYTEQLRKNRKTKRNSK